MKTKSPEYFGEATILGNVTAKLYFGPTSSQTDATGDREGKSREVVFNHRLCGRAVANLAAGYVAAAWEELIAENPSGTWKKTGEFLVAGVRWKLVIANRLRDECDIYASHRTRELFIKRGTAADMAILAMQGVETLWGGWQMRTLRASMRPIPEQLSPAECAAFKGDWEAVIAKLEAA